MKIRCPKCNTIQAVSAITRQLRPKHTRCQCCDSLFNPLNGLLVKDQDFESTTVIAAEPIHRHSQQLDSVRENRSEIVTIATSTNMAELIQLPDLSNNPYRQAIDELQASTCQKEFWALELLRAEELQYIEDEQCRELERQITLLEHQQPEKTEQDFVATIPSDQYLVVDAIEEYDLEDAWALELLDQKDKLQVFQQLLNDQMQTRQAV